MIGSGLAHFQILERIGAGGMGVVYKARDTRLNRLVAIKVLPPDKLTDAHRKQRFIQEAQAASALNHPNIVTIHDINSENGVDFIVMEYISGKTVDALIPRHGMRLPEVLRICIAVADGLAKAHSAGIIHRDIKPSNLIVADDGRVKILDFGLAKLTESAESSEEDTTQTQRPTTGEGVVLGTVAYMSPEQVEGRKLDARTDIFSFGAVLYEMLSGHKAFAGTSSVLTLSAILREDPPKPENLPPDVDRVLRRCLRKDLAKRFQHMDDLRVALEELRDESESGDLKVSEEVAKPRRRKWAIPVVALLAISAITTLLFAARRNWKGAEPAPASVRLRQLTADTGLTASPDISRDGKLLVYASDRGTSGNLDLYVHPMTEGATPIRLTTNPADDWQPSLSPDGGQIAFSSRREGNNIYVIPALGGEERLIVRGGTHPKFSPDGKWIAYSTTNNLLADSELFVIPTTGGTPRRLAADVGWAGAPAWSPDGKRLLFLGQDAPNTAASMQFWLASLDGSKSTRTNLRELAERKSARFSVGAFHWSGDTAIFVVSEPGGGSELWSVHLDAKTGEASNPQRLTRTTSGLSHIRGNMQRLVVSAGRVSLHLWKLPIDLDTGKTTGALQLIPHSGGSQFTPASSLDGTVLAYGQESPSTRDMRIRFADGRESVLVIEPARPRVSPDGSQVAYSTMTGSGSKGLFLMNAKGGQSTTLLDRTQAATLYGWTTDGKDLVFWNGTPIRFSLFNLETRQQSTLISHLKHNIHGAELSPDRRWVAFHLVGAESSPVLIAPVRDGKAAGEAEWSTIASYPGYNRRPWWSPNGNLLYFISERDGTSCVWAQRLEPASKRPQGDAFPVFHFHEARRTVSAAAASFGPAVSRNALVFGLLERVSDIWIGEKEQAGSALQR